MGILCQVLLDLDLVPKCRHLLSVSENSSDFFQRKASCIRIEEEEGDRSHARGTDEDQVRSPADVVECDGRDLQPEQVGHWDALKKHECREMGQQDS